MSIDNATVKIAQLNVAETIRYMMLVLTNRTSNSNCDLSAVLSADIFQDFFVIFFKKIFFFSVGLALREFVYVFVSSCLCLCMNVNTTGRRCYQLSARADEQANGGQPYRTNSTDRTNIRIERHLP